MSSIIDNKHYIKQNSQDNQLLHQDQLDLAILCHLGDRVAQPHPNVQCYPVYPVRKNQITKPEI